MIQFARVSMSEVAKSGRLDPGFHITSQRLKAKVKELEQSLPTEIAVALIGRAVQVMEPERLSTLLASVRRGETKRSLDGRELERLSKAHPHLVLALLVEGIPQAQESVESRVRALHAQHEALGEVLAMANASKALTASPKRPSPR